MSTPILLSLCVLKSLLFIHETKNFEGYIYNENSDPLPNVVVQLYLEDDSTRIDAVSTNKDGFFLLTTIRSGLSHLIEVSALGYKTKRLTLIPDTLTTPLVVILEENVYQLDELFVTAERPEILYTNEGISVKIDEYTSVGGGVSLHQLLEMMPQVQYIGGNFEIIGRGRSKLLVDGRERPAEWVANLSTDEISEVEILFDPSARYPGEGGGGIINITTITDSRRGLHTETSINYGYSKYNRFGGRAAVSYGKDLWNFRISNNLRYSKGFEDLRETLHFVDADDFAQQNMLTYKTDPTLVNTFRSGLEFKPIQDHTIYAEWTNTFRNQDMDLDTQTFLSGFDQNQTRLFTNTINQVEDNYNQNFVFLNHEFSPRELDYSITTVFDFFDYSRDVPQSFLTNYFANRESVNPDSNVVLHSDRKTDLRIYGVQVDYKQPLNLLGQIETGLHTSVVHSENQMNFSGNQITISDTAPNSEYQYDEQTGAGYVQISPQIDAHSFSLGVRAEYNKLVGQQLLDSEQFENTSWKLLPNILWSYQVNDNNRISTGYNRRVDRPAYEQLNPFIYYNNPFSYAVGNPELRPQLSNNFSLTHIFMGVFRTGLTYTHASDIHSEVYEQNVQGYRRITSFENLTSHKQWALSVSGRIEPFPWWSFSFSGSVMHTTIDATHLEHTYFRQHPGWSGNTNHIFLLNDSWRVRVNAMYFSKTLYGISELEDWGTLSLELDWNPDSNWQAGLRLDDIMQTRVFRGSTEFADINNSYRLVRNSRSIGFTIRYAFSRGKEQYDRNVIDSPTRKDRQRL